MSVLPQRVSLVSQTSAFIRSEIESGEWEQWLPGERVLCQMLQVSRNTLRRALAKLQADGVVETIHGAGHRILNPGSGKARPAIAHDVAMLSPEPLERLRPSHTLWIDELRGMLGERNVRLRVFHGHRYFRARPGPVLSELVTRHRHGCWILIMSNEAIQRWFARSGLPCLVAGSVHRDSDLPCRDVEYRAVGRHAVGRLLAMGHRRIGLFLPREPRMGDSETEAGFREGLAQSSHSDVQGFVAPHDSDVGDTTNTLRRIMNQNPSPTGLIVSNPYSVLTIAGKLFQMGLRIPEDVSLISREDEPFLSYFLPSTARYVTSPHEMAQSLLGPVLDLLNGGVITQPRSFLMPKFIAGDSLGPAPA